MDLNKLPAILSEVDLVNSYVLDVTLKPGSLIFSIDVALLPNHPEYHTPRKGEAFCFREGQLEFNKPNGVNWKSSDLMPATDATGELDYGGFDNFVWNSTSTLLEGDFGQISVDGGQITLHFNAIGKITNHKDASL